MTDNCVCLVCHKPFHEKPSRIATGKGKFCSATCYYSWQIGQPKGKRTRYEKPCEYCGKSFFVTPANAIKGWGRYCSRDCRSAADRNRKQVACLFCGKEISVKIGASRVFCSRDCQTKYRVGKKTGAENSYWKGGTPERTCATCGVTFRKYESWAKYCSRKCSTAGRTGAGSYLWQGGISYEPYPIEFNRSLKREIRERDGYKCVLCGTDANIVHHVDYNKNNCSPDNLRTVCRSCHGKTNTKREHWIRVFSTMKGLRNEKST